jgi:hypothetical protein
LKPLTISTFMSVIVSVDLSRCSSIYFLIIGLVTSKIFWEMSDPMALYSSSKNLMIFCFWFKLNNT